jgi:1-acyl-sn-glycerol-3-phosphate acyltransferase
MIYKATHNFIIYPFFIRYSIRKIKRNFHNVFISGEFREKNLPLLLISNHISWWDGFWAVYLNMKLFHRKFYFMMLEDQLKKHMFFNKTGGYSVKKGSKSIIETIDYTASLLADPKNMVLLFPQGKIESLYTKTIKFETGIEHIIKRLSSDIQVIFLVNLIDYFSNPRPGLYMYFKEYQGKDFTTEKIQEEFNRFYYDCISNNQLKKES